MRVVGSDPCRNDAPEHLITRLAALLRKHHHELFFQVRHSMCCREASVLDSAALEDGSLHTPCSVGGDGCLLGVPGVAPGSGDGEPGQGQGVRGHRRAAETEVAVRSLAVPSPRRSPVGVA